MLQDWVRRGTAPLGEPRICSSGFCQSCPQTLNTVNMLGAGSAVSLGVESQKPHSLPNSGGELFPPVTEFFSTPARTPLALPLRQHNSPGSAQAQATQKPGGGVSCGCLATATSCRATQRRLAGNTGAWLSSGMGEENTPEQQDTNCYFQRTKPFSSLS